MVVANQSFAVHVPVKRTASVLGRFASNNLKNSKSHTLSSKKQSPVTLLNAVDVTPYTSTMNIRATRKPVFKSRSSVISNAEMARSTKVRSSKPTTLLKETVRRFASYALNATSSQLALSLRLTIVYQTSCKK